MSELTPSVITLDKGLNLQVPKIVAPAGSLLDCLNYEQVDFQGLKRIDGYARYDGSALPAIDDYYEVTTDGSLNVVAGSLIFDAEGTLFGLVVGNSGVALNVAVINMNVKPNPGDVLTWVDYEFNNTGTVTVVEAKLGVDTGLSPDDHYFTLLAIMANMRDRIETLPGGVIGLHWFRDRLYAVADVTTIFVNDTGNNLQPNDQITAFGETVKVLDVVRINPSTAVVFVSARDSAKWSLQNAPIVRNGSTVASTIPAIDFAASSQIASFFESRTELQVLSEDTPGSEDFGWRFVDHGWQVLFENGLSLFGSLPSLNQNISGLGTQGPTDTAGNNGRALGLTQKVVITNKQDQVNGWKTSNTPLSYNLDPAAVAESDLQFIYADAFISWDGTGAVEAPGITSGTLPEYPASNTVEIELP